MRVLVTGGRTYSDRDRVFSVLSKIHAATPITRIIHGAAAGADALAAEWAVAHGITIAAYPAQWDDVKHVGAKVRWNKAYSKPYDASAGFRRNIQMILSEAPALCVAFPGGRGTDHCHGSALRHNIACLQVYPNNTDHFSPAKELENA